MPIHTCKVCGKTVSRSTKLTEHLRSHTGERPFICTHFGCRKSFFRSYDLTKHKELHDGSLKYCCAILKNGEQRGCGKRFQRKRDLKRHLERKTAGRCLDTCTKTAEVRTSIHDKRSPLPGILPGLQQLPSLTDFAASLPELTTPPHHDTDPFGRLYSNVRPRTQTSSERTFTDGIQAFPTNHSQATASITAMPEVVPSPAPIPGRAKIGLGCGSESAYALKDRQRAAVAQIQAGRWAYLSASTTMYTSRDQMQLLWQKYSGLRRLPQTLFVDDHVEHRASICYYGYSCALDWIVDRKRDGVEAFRKLSRENEHGDGYNVVSLNFSPGFDVLMKCAVIHRTSSIPIVIVAGGIEPLQTRRYSDRGISDVLLNPGFDELLATINKYFEHPKTSQAATDEDILKCLENRVESASDDDQHDSDELPTMLCCPRCGQTSLEYADMEAHMSTQHPTLFSMLLK